MQKYTVLLLYPDYMNEGGVETYLAHVTALSRADAITEARIEARDLDGNSECDDGDDFAVLMVMSGHIAEIFDMPPAEPVKVELGIAIEDERAYDAYYTRCETANVTPMPFGDWYAARAKEAL